MMNSLRSRFLGILIAACEIILVHGRAGAQEVASVVAPGFGDKYCKLVMQLESGHTEINYVEFKDNFLSSEQFKVAAEHRYDLDSLRREMHSLMRERQYAKIIDVTKKMLSIDYTDMEAHKILQQTYKIVGDAVNHKKYHDIEFGLLNSVTRRGDGKTCETAWPVVQVREEYFMLEMLGAKVRKQSLERVGDRTCDKMEVQTPDGPKVYYFNVNKVFEGYKKQRIK